MGILWDALSILGGTFLGRVFGDKMAMREHAVFGISIMIISAVGFLENVFTVSDGLESRHLILIMLALIGGSLIGDALHLEEKLVGLGGGGGYFSPALDAALFFGIGGLQISGPILLAAGGDSTQLIIKSLVDLPFAIMFGASYGKRVALSALPVALCQLLIAGITYLSAGFFDDALIRQLCDMGYIVLFFSGYNLVCEKRNRISNINMLPGILIVIIIHIFVKVWGRLV